MVIRYLPRRISLPVIAALSCLALPFGAQAEDAGKPQDSAGEAELARLLEGRTKGEPQGCLRDSQRRSMEVIDRTAFVFRDGDTIYVNRPEGATFLDQFDVPVFRVYGSDVCRLDQVELRSRTSGIGGPVVVLNDFIPYKREKEPKQ
ncbi:hypothetical protein [Allopontixanthobacter sp.]|uniref:hypothetical protein n=1 Tax=Allopontixanthobacter sp. TaxID=2906452 RepID=UPI002ABC5459|nr:hypothetical protein [Allopontixanthobacter sp.]MDZ4308539.1 hypothetical protein [Allopontixanthobacter sp.]